MRDIRVSERQGVGETIRGLIGIYPIRCRRCNERWETSVWENSAWKYARCPRCYRQELSTWSEHYYNPPTGTKLKLRLGATPYRCAACRCNFASFKKCKERFAWRHQDRPIAETGQDKTAPAAIMSIPLPNGSALRNRGIQNPTFREARTQSNIQNLDSSKSSNQQSAGSETIQEPTDGSHVKAP